MGSSKRVCCMWWSVMSVMSVSLFGGCVDQAAANEASEGPIAEIAPIVNEVNQCDPETAPLRDLGGYVLLWNNVYRAIDPPLGNQWTDPVCSTGEHFSNATFFPGMARAGTHLVFRYARVSQADFARYWSLTTGATIDPTAQLLDRLPLSDSYSLRIIGGAAGVLETQLAYGFPAAGGCLQRATRTARFAPAFGFNATPGTSAAVSDGGTPYITEICDTAHRPDFRFGYVEVFVP